MNVRLPNLRPSALRTASIALFAALLVALAGAASPALAQTTEKTAPYDTTPPPTETLTPPPTKSTPAPTKPTPPPSNTQTQGTTPAPANGGQKGAQASGNQNAPANQPAQTSAAPSPSAGPAASTGSTGSPARLAYTGAEPLLIGALGAAMLLAAGALYRRRQIT